MELLVFGVLAIVTIGCIAQTVKEFRERDNVGMRIYATLGSIVGLLLLITFIVSYVTHWL